MELISTKGLRIKIAGKCVCDKLDWMLQSGQIWAVLGQNGVGKSTLLRTLAGLGHPEAGTIRILGRDLAHWTQHDLALSRGLLFQMHEDPFPSTVLETALIGRHAHLGRWRREGTQDHKLARQALTLVDMGDLAHREVSSLSGGERQRLALATVLTQDPQVMLLDEPTSHLDLRHQVHVMRLLRELAVNSQKGLVTVLHDVNMAARYCDNALLLFGDGETQAGSINEVLTADNLKRLYNHPVTCLETPDGTVYLPRDSST